MHFWYYSWNWQIVPDIQKDNLQSQRGVLLDPEDEGNIDLQNIANYSPVDNSVTSQKTWVFFGISFMLSISPHAAVGH